MKHFFEKNGITVLVAALLLTALVSIGSAIVPLDPLRNLLGVLATPFRALSGAVVGWGESTYRYATEYDELKDRVRELEAQVARMEAENRDANQTLEENRRLRELLNLREKRSDFVFESAMVTGRTGNSWSSTLTISKGSIHGVEAGDCVVTETGALVGIIADAGVNWSTVTTIVDPDSSIGAVVFRTQDDGILEGDLTLMTEGKCKLSYLSTQAELVSGDEVLTSGMGGKYPYGLVIGTVEQVHTIPSGVEQYAVLTPAANLERVSEVFVIKDFDQVE